MEDPPDPYVAAEALRSLARLESPNALQPWLEPLAREGPVLLRQAAREILGAGG